MATLFPFWTEFEVRGYEIDFLHHTNNAVYLNWLEHARWKLMQHPAYPPPPQDLFIVIRHVSLDYRHDTHRGEVVRATLWPKAVGNTSFTLGSRIDIVKSQDPQRQGKLALVAQQTLVCAMPGMVKTPVPDSWRQAMHLDHGLGEDGPALPK